MSSWLSGTKRALIISIRPISLMISAMSPQWSKRSTVTNAIITPPLRLIGSSRYSEEDKWFFYFAHLLNVGSKVLYPDIYEHQSFTWDEAGFFAANTCYFIPTKEKWLTALFNSHIIEWFYS